MSKELEALKRVKNFLGYNYCSVDLPNELELIEQALQRLEAIDNSNPSEALKDLKELHELAYGNDKTSWKIDEIVQSSHIKQALLKAQEQEKVLKIIKRVYTDLCFILSFDTFEEYNKSCDLISVEVNLKRVNKEEFELLKEVLR